VPEIGGCVVRFVLISLTTMSGEVNEIDCLFLRFFSFVDPSI
mgnify:CR=1